MAGFGIKTGGPSIGSRLIQKAPRPKNPKQIQSENAGEVLSPPAAPNPTRRNYGKSDMGTENPLMSVGGS